jgi:hypothetical protein
MRSVAIGFAGVLGVLALAMVSSPGAAHADEPVPAPLPPGVRLVSGQAAIVAGNTAGARERALDEAMQHAVEQALA